MAILLTMLIPIFPANAVGSSHTTDSSHGSDRYDLYREFPEHTDVTINFSYQFEVTGGSADVDLNVAIPFDIPLSTYESSLIVQDVTDVHLSTVNIGENVYEPLPYEDHNTHMNQISGWRLTDIRGDISIEAEFSARLYYQKWNVNTTDSGTTADITSPYKDLYLDDEWEVDQDDDGIPEQYRYHPGSPIIQRTAYALTDQEPTVLGKVRAIYDWMRQHFNTTADDQRVIDKIKYGAYPKWPEGCIADWYGDNDDQSLLMASMLRAVGIPAWLELGYRYDRSIEQWFGHGWLNVVIPVRSGWEFHQVVAPIDIVHQEFLTRDPYRITEWVDNGTSFTNEKGELTFNLDHYYNFFSETSGPQVMVFLGPTTITTPGFEEYGYVRDYYDHIGEQGDDDSSLPLPNPILLVPLLFLMALPAIRSRRR